MKTKVGSFNAIICFIIVVFFCILACDNGSVSDSSAAAKSNGLVKVSLSVGEKTSVGLQKSISVNSDIVIGSLICKYNAVPQWVGSRIYGAADWTTVNYSDEINLGYFTPGLWKFGVRLIKVVDGNEVIVYEGYSGVESISTSSVAINVVISKIVEQAAKSVTISVTAPTVEGESLSISYTGTASSAEPITANIAGRANGLTTFEYSFSQETTALDSGNYTFTLSHPLGGSGAAVAIELRPGEQVQITGHIDNGIWQVGYITVKIHTIDISTYTECCTITTNIASAAAGDRVSFYVTPYPGSMPEGNIYVSWAGGSINPILPVNGMYTFTMPDADVYIHAIYSGVDSAINISHFKAVLKILFDSNPGAISFGPSAEAPSNEVEYFEVKNLKLWCEDNHILWHTSNHSVTFQAGSMLNLFKDCNTLQTIDLTGFITNAVTNMAGMFQNCTALTSVTFDNEKDANGKFVNFDTSSVEDMAQMFDNCIALTSLNLAGLKTTNVESMCKMFFGCRSLTGIEFDTKKANGKYVNFDTSSVIDMSYMFSSTDFTGSSVDTLKMKFTSLDVSGFDTSSVETMNHMFYLCSDRNLTTLDVSGFDTSNVTDMGHMFACYKNAPSSLTNLDLSNWDFREVTTVAHMFDRCESLCEGLIFPGETNGRETNFKSLTTMDQVFGQCLNLTPDKLRRIIATWKFSEHGDDWENVIYGKNDPPPKENSTSMFGNYENSNAGQNAGANYIIRKEMVTTGSKYFVSRNTTGYATKDYKTDAEGNPTNEKYLLYVGGGGGDARNLRLTTKATF